MSEEDLKIVISKYQKKCFDLFNTNIILETQVEKLNSTINALTAEIATLKNENLNDTDDKYN